LTGIMIDVEKRIWLEEGLSKAKQLKIIMEHFQTNRAKFTDSLGRLTDAGTPVYKQILKLAGSVFPHHESYFTEQAKHDYPWQVTENRIGAVFDYIERLLQASEGKAGFEDQAQKYKNESEALQRKCEELENQNKLLAQQLALLQKSHEKILEIAPLASLSKLLEEARPLGVDENWAIGICALNLLEAAVTKKLDDLGEYSGDSFEARYRRLVETVRRKEHRDIDRLLPKPFYDARSKLVHGGHKHRPTPEETEIMVKYVTNFIKDLFPT